jgi:hypothetical protein
MPLSDYARDRFIAPHLSKFTNCEIPNLTSEYESFETRLSRFIGGSMFTTNFSPPLHGLLFMFLRRTQAVTDEYESARQVIGEFLNGGRKWIAYFRALYHFENLAAQAHQAYVILEEMGSLQNPPIDEKKIKDTTLERIYHASKHADGKLIRDFENARKRGQVPADVTMPLWLTNEGIETFGNKCLRYEEIVEIVQVLNDCGRQTAELPQILAAARNGISNART